MIVDGVSYDAGNPKYRQFKRGDDILEYTLEGSEITVDWVSGNDATLMMNAILRVDGKDVTCISGYVTDKLGNATNATLQRFGRRIARELNGDWTSTIQTIEGRRYLKLKKRES